MKTSFSEPILNIKKTLDNEGYEDFLLDMADAYQKPNYLSGHALTLYTLLLEYPDSTPLIFGIYRQSINAWVNIPAHRAQDALASYKAIAEHFNTPDHNEDDPYHIPRTTLIHYCNFMQHYINLSQLPEDTPFDTIKDIIATLSKDHPQWKEPLEEELTYRKHLADNKKIRKKIVIGLLSGVLPLLIIMNIFTHRTTPITPIEPNLPITHPLTPNEITWCQKERYTIKHAANRLHHDIGDHITQGIIARYERSVHDWDEHCNTAYPAPPTDAEFRIDALTEQTLIDTWLEGAQQ